MGVDGLRCRLVSGGRQSKRAPSSARRSEPANSMCHLPISFISWLLVSRRRSAPVCTISNLNKRPNCALGAPNLPPAGTLCSLVGRTYSISARWLPLFDCLEEDSSLLHCRRSQINVRALDLKRNLRTTSPTTIPKTIRVRCAKLMSEMHKFDRIYNIYMLRARARLFSRMESLADRLFSAHAQQLQPQLAVCCLQ